MSRSRSQRRTNSTPRNARDFYIVVNALTFHFKVRIAASDLIFFMVERVTKPEVCAYLIAVWR